jgi:hypothetical protein
MGKFLAFLGVLARAFACESVYVPPCEAGSQNDQIFVGTAIEERTPFGPFRFSIDEALKGIAPGTKEIEVGPGPCEAGYQAGRQYLILVHHPSGERTPGFTLGERVEDAAESIGHFRALARGEHVTALKGRIAENVADNSVRFDIDYKHRPGLPGVEITASKEGRTYTTYSDFSGSYLLQVPEAGRYRVVAKFAGHASANPAYELDVAPDSCKELSLGMWTASRLTGHLIGADGKPADGIAVQLMPASERRNSPPLAKTDASGRFEFTNIPPGDYVVGVNITGLNSKLPYDTRYYPGVSERSAAGVVKIAGAQTIERLDFRIGERKPTRRIVVSVEWSDGRPVINASVNCLSSSGGASALRRDFVSRYVDLNGEATCQVLADRDFVVDADRLSWAASSRPIQPIAARPKLSVQAGSDTVRLRFVIDLVNDISAREAPTNMSLFNEKEF